MILVDANLLVYAHVSSVPQHARARTWLDAQLNGAHQVGLPWASLLAFVRLISNPRVFARPASVGEAWAQATCWLDAPTVWIPGPTDRHRQILEKLLGGQRFRSNLVPDSHLAALAVEHGLTLCSSDGDFAQFAGVRWVNPLLKTPEP